MLGAPRLRQRLVRRRVACATGRLICIYLYLVFYFFYTSIYLSVSLEVTVTSLNPPRLCHRGIFSKTHLSLVMIASWWNPPGWRWRPKEIDYPFALRRRHFDRCWQAGVKLVEDCPPRPRTS